MLKKDTLSHYKEVYQIEWANTLPENCPPEDILVPENEEFYRLLTHKDKIVEKDWKTYIELFPDKEYFGDNLLMANGLSILKDIDVNVLKLPQYKRFKGIARLILNPTDGVVKKTYGANHYTLWRTTFFDESSAEIVSNEKD
ncbi:MAG: hypothetical protein J1E37_06135 [Prevotella sp.]|nr:hypothetical protein [Prevotella sp.]